MPLPPPAGEVAAQGADGEGNKHGYPLIYAPRAALCAVALRNAHAGAEMMRCAVQGYILVQIIGKYVTG